MAAPAYAQVAVQLPVPGLFHYAVPEALADHRSLIGHRILVPFGRRSVTGVVVGMDHEMPPGVTTLRPLSRLLDARPAVSQELIELCLWVARYYEAHPGEVLRAALPPGTRVSGTLVLTLTPAGAQALAGEGAALSRGQRELLAEVGLATSRALQKALLATAKRRTLVDQLAAAGLVSWEESLRHARVKERSTRVVTLRDDADPAVIAGLARAPKRKSVHDMIAGEGGTIELGRLRQSMGARAADHVRALVRLGLAELRQQAVTDLVAAACGSEDLPAESVPPPLSEAQTRALTALRGQMQPARFAPFLLHGITGSGKTEVYLHAIGEMLARGRSALVLVPEISLTPQLAARFRARFGDDVAVLHSALSPRERFDEWQRLHRGQARIALGARSAVFAPLANIGMIVVDEEHDSSFKQEEGVRYNARNVALVRAQNNQAICILGSATPSLESFHAAKQGRYTLLSLPERPTPRPLPTVEIVDMRQFLPDSESMLTAPLREAMASALAREEQVILFLNRRGFATFILCTRCGHSFRCKRCSVSLTYHRARDRLLCHYCGYRESVPTRCPSCARDDGITRRGLGTERIADAVLQLFPSARVARLDRDIASGSSVKSVLAQVSRNEVDILVGTQMVTKGHDFPRVTLVGVLCADTGLSLPDFRASERTFQLLSQVAGRAGRGDRPGRVIIQTYRSQEPAVIAAAAHDYEGFFAAESAIREELGYPPYGYLAAIRIDGTDAAAVANAANSLASRARNHADPEVGILGPAEAPLSRLKGRTRWHLWLRAPKRQLLRQVLRGLIAADESSGVRITIDVDPVSAL